MPDNNYFSLPTNTLDLPSKGLIYPDGHPLSKGTVELLTPSARSEDILTNRNFINQGIVIDKFIESLIVTKMNKDDILIGDKNAIMLAARVLAFGKDYSFTYRDPVDSTTEDVTVDLSAVINKEIDYSLFTPGKNEFEFTLPLTKNVITFKLLTSGDEKKIEEEAKSLLKINKNMTADVTLRLAYTIQSVNGTREKSVIRDFANNIPIQDSRELRKYINKITPDVNLVFDFTRKNGEVVEGLDIPMTVDFFWPKR